LAFSWVALGPKCVIFRLQRLDVDVSATPARPLGSRCVGSELVAELDLPAHRTVAVEQATEVARDITIAVVGATAEQPPKAGP